MILFLVLLGLFISSAGVLPDRTYEKWSPDEAVAILNDSPWARQTTFTEVVKGVGSGVRGEKEIFHTFYTRILSSLPVRQAFVRVARHAHDYENLSSDDRARFDRLASPGLNLDFDDWIVIAVFFRSNDPDRELEVKRFFEVATTASLQNRVFLSTPESGQIPLLGYVPPRGDGVGAKFIFPRKVEDRKIVTQHTKSLVFELEVPHAEPLLSVIFDVGKMRRGGRLEL